MSLTLVAVPIGNPDDITIRGLKSLKEADLIILEERKEGSQFLRHHGISGKEYLELNEHTKADDLNLMMQKCQHYNVALMTDAGTPGFCDPGADLVRVCRQNDISIITIPGASSIMALLSLSGQRINEFIFRGFISPETTQRQKDWKILSTEKKAFIIMDTPYRLQKMLEEISTNIPNRKILIALDVTQPTEQILEGQIAKVRPLIKSTKAEFIILVYPQD
jgi:16S rRNA (cytidine1402-2'-O)-methyltransferase